MAVYPESAPVTGLSGSSNKAVIRRPTRVRFCSNRGRVFKTLNVAHRPALTMFVNDISTNLRDAATIGASSFGDWSWTTDTKARGALAA